MSNQTKSQKPETFTFTSILTKPAAKPVASDVGTVFAIKSVIGGAK